MLQHKVASYFRVSAHIVWANISAAAEYRLNFALQVLGMCANNIFFLLVWWILFTRVPQINGWTLKDTMVLFAIGTIGYGLALFLGGGASQLSRCIVRGELDIFLVYPKSTIWHVIMSSSNLSALGDLLTGVMLFVLVGGFSIEQVLIIGIVSVLIAVCLVACLTIVHSLTFWLGDFSEAADLFFNSLILLTIYPQSCFTGALKIVTMTILPAFFIAGLPVRAINNIVWGDVLIVGCFTIFISLLAIFIFNLGLKRYESGNLIGGGRSAAV